jgi:hypothetical protein
MQRREDVKTQRGGKEERRREEEQKAESEKSDEAGGLVFTLHSSPFTLPPPYSSSLLPTYTLS